VITTLRVFREAIVQEAELYKQREQELETLRE
jgi:hypothetical protein